MQILDALVDLHTFMYQYVSIWNTVYVFAHAEKLLPCRSTSSGFSLQSSHI
jgi:hypothetical protein